MKYKCANYIGMGVLLWVGAVFGTENNNEKCQDIQDSLNVIVCSKNERDKADSQLNESYRFLIARIKSQYKLDQSLGDKYLSEVKNSQLAWMILRDRNCTLEAFEIERESQAYEVVVNDCVTRMSEGRSDYLKSISPILH